MHPGFNSGCREIILKNKNNNKSQNILLKLDGSLTLYMKKELFKTMNAAH